jgi:hypothetical protein
MTAQATPTVLTREQRATVRFHSYSEGDCQTLSICLESAWEATVRNISCEGIGIVLYRRFEPGTVLAIEITPLFEEIQRLLLARVVHVKFQRENTTWLLGCILLRPLSEDELQEFLSAGSLPLPGSV